MDNVPNEILRDILFLLTNDGITVGRLALCSTSLHKRVVEQHPDVWKALVRNRWRRGSESVLQTDSKEDNDCNFQREYIERHQIDATAVQRLQEITRDLQSILHLNDEAPLIDGNSHVGQAWDHPAWPYFLQQGSKLLDVLHSIAQPVPTLPTEPNNTDVDSGGSTSNDDNTSVFDRLYRFLAARCFQNVHFADCLMEWKRLHNIEHSALLNFESTVKAHLESNKLLEQWAFLVCRIQQTPLELLRENHMDVEQRAINMLDEIADACRTKIAEISQLHKCRPPSTMARMKIVNSVLKDDYGFLGNEADYYNYHNSLLNCLLESKKGIPMTLCILYACICRRLEIPVYLIGLPGRMVLGFDNDDASNDDDDGCYDSSTMHRQEEIYMDVFYGGRFLSIADCQELAASYGISWRYVNVNPLRNETALQRIMGNLSNCHLEPMALRPPFHSDLFFQVRALRSISDQPSGIAEFLVDRIAQELPVTLSHDLLRAYGLLSPQDDGVQS